MEAHVSIESKRLLKPSLLMFFSSFVVFLFFLQYAFPSTSDFITLTIFIIASLYILWTSSLPTGLKYTVSITTLLKSIYTYKLHTTIISVFPDSFNYLNYFLEVLKYPDLLLKPKEMSQVVHTSQLPFYYLMYIVHLLFDSNLAFYMVNILLFVASVIMFFKVIEKDFGLKIATYTTVLFSCSFTMTIFTSNILKDSLTLFLTVLTLHIYKKKDRISIAVSVCIALLLFTRVYTGCAIMAAVFLDYLFRYWKKIKFISKIINIIVPCTVLFLIINTNLFFDLFSNSEKFINENSQRNILLSAVEGLFQMIFAPYPWGTLLSSEVSPYSIIEVDSLFLMLSSFMLLMFMVKFFRYKELRVKTYIYLIPILIHAVTLGLAYDGGSTRQRIAVFGFIILIFVLGLLYKPKINDNN